MLWNGMEIWEMERQRHHSIGGLSLDVLERTWTRVCSPLSVPIYDDLLTPNMTYHHSFRLRTLTPLSTLLLCIIVQNPSHIVAVCLPRPYSSV